MKNKMIHLINSHCDFGTKTLVSNLIDAIEAKEADRAGTKKINWKRLPVLLKHFKNHVEVTIDQLTEK